MFHCCCATPSDSKQPVELPEVQYQDLFTKSQKPTDLDSLHEEGVFNVTFTRETNGQPLGLGLDAFDGVRLYISGLREGLCDKHNAGAPAELRIQIGDYILGVNSIRGDARLLLQELGGEKALTLAMSHAEEFEVRMERHAGGTLGLKLGWSKDGKCLVVMQVDKGAVQDWNAANPAMAVVKGDRVLRVNACDQSPAEMMQAIQTSKEVVLKMSRPRSECLIRGQ